MIRDYTTSDTGALIAIWDKAEKEAHPFLPQSVRDQVRKDMRNMKQAGTQPSRWQCQLTDKRLQGASRERLAFTLGDNSPTAMMPTADLHFLIVY